NLIAELTKGIDAQAKRALNQIQQTLVLIRKTTGIRVSRRQHLTRAEKQARKIIPKRRFKGTLSRETLSRKALPPKDYEWYTKISRRDKQFNQKLAEILNFADGKRDLQQIVNAVSAEYAPTNPEDMLRVLQHLQKQSLVTLKTR
ncbi:MAG: hypothetical protein PVF15_09780, partial [Candidatus Bathyarchaeota archaeon]